MPEAVVLLLAAGASTRMQGADKLLEPVDGVPLLRRQALAALGSGLPVLVALPPGAGPRRAPLAGLAVTPITVSDAALGMGHSLAAGAKAVMDLVAKEGAARDRAAGVRMAGDRALGDPAGDAVALMVLNADMPDIGTAEILSVLAAFRADPRRIHRGASGDVPGHPVLFPSRLVPELTQLRGDGGARALVAREGAALVPLPGDAAVLDLDTPQDWAAWRMRRPTVRP